MKIIHISASYKPAFIYGGPIMSVSMLCEWLVERSKLKAESSKLKLESKKFNLEVFTTTANGRIELDVEDRKLILVDGVPVTYFRRWTKDQSHFSPGLLLGLRKKISQFKNPLPSISSGESPRVKGEQEPPRLTAPPPKEGNELVIHLHAWWNLVSVLSCLVAKWYNVPVVLSPRGMLTAYSQKNNNTFLKKLMQWLIGNRLLKYCHIHVTSVHEKRDVLHIIQPKSVTIIPNLVDVKGADKLKAESSKIKTQNIDHTLTFKLLFLSRIEEKKGLELLFDALARLDFTYCLTIAGSGEDSYVESLKRKVESLKLGERIEWVGQVSNEDKFELLAAYDLMVLPSYNENFANVVVESLSVGTPVLVSEKVGLADYVKANDLGWICSLEPKNIAEKITEACASRDKREKINSTAPTIIKRDFNDEVLVERYLELYGDVLQLGSNTKNSQPKIS